jgi:hyaluronan synthase
VVIPAYNEGRMVEMALYSVAQADYPKDKLEIICVDDGSTDDTWQYIEQGPGSRFPHLIKTIRFPQNRGKKQALAAGFTAARGEVLVTVDSDSVIEAQALRHLVAPLQEDPTIGAVAGNVKVYNRHQSLMGKMQGVRFVNLDFLRASQSLYKTVICTPGSLSAYRREAVLPILTAWLNQTFLGAPCHHSEDRALTNFILKSGYYTCYQRSAVVHTLVPETYAGVCRMYLRWERGNVRESCVMLGYLFTRYRGRHRLLPVVECLLTQLEGPLAAFFFGALLLSMAVYPAILFKLLMLLGIMSTGRPHLLPLPGTRPGGGVRRHLLLLRLLSPPVDLPLRLGHRAPPGLADQVMEGGRGPGVGEGPLPLAQQLSDKVLQESVFKPSPSAGRGVN